MGCANSKLDVVNGNAHVDNNGEKQTTVNGKSAPAAVDFNSFEEQYTLGKVIGSGTFSVVRIAVHKPTNQRYAIKCIKRDGLVAEDIEALTTEVAILKQINHPNIMILHDFFVEDEFYYLVTEFMEGGELFDRIVEKSYYNEREARDLMKLLMEAINEGLVTACGTPGYVAPEILEGKPYGKTKIKNGKFQFDSPYWDHVSDDAKDLISQMLVVDPEKRATIDQLLAHRWVTGTEVATVQLTSALEELRRFNARRKFKAAVSTVSTSVGFSKKYSKLDSRMQLTLNQAPNVVNLGSVSETLPDTVDLDKAI
ncbi:unnamed protein product [Peronospora belbahrii]|uniref:non-specific serine/threonine protein kinase n=1 Tax=Peronospora belbahrii TaxID=622444 RepID=A0AAU9LAW2_9STRA|nr:unnamed protein product [Peronospora belbahrii]